jgi:hypothetical protein
VLPRESGMPLEPPTSGRRQPRRTCQDADELPARPDHLDAPAVPDVSSAARCAGGYRPRPARGSPPECTGAGLCKGHRSVRVDRDQERPQVAVRRRLAWCTNTSRTIGGAKGIPHPRESTGGSVGPLTLALAGRQPSVRPTAHDAALPFPPALNSRPSWRRRTCSAALSPHDSLATHPIAPGGGQRYRSTRGIMEAGHDPPGVASPQIANSRPAPIASCDPFGCKHQR